MREKKKFEYKWIIAGCCFLMIFGIMITFLVTLKAVDKERRRHEQQITEQPA